MLLQVNGNAGKQLFICNAALDGWVMVNDDTATTATDKSYTDAQVAAEATARIAGDAATLSSANSHSDAAVAAETATRAAADATLGAAIVSETSRATSAENALNTSKANLTGGNSFTGDQSITGNVSVTGSETVNGTLSLPAAKAGVAPSQPLDLAGSDGANPTLFRWFVNSGGKLDLFTATNGNAAADSGLMIGTDGKIAFAAGQTFPGTQNALTAGSGISIVGNTISNTGVLSFNGSTGPVTGVSSVASGNSGITIGGTSANPAISNAGVLSVAGDGIVVTSTGGQTPVIAMTGVVPIAHGGTGSSTQNFVDMASNQSVAGNKTFSGTVTMGDAVVNQGSNGASSDALFGKRFTDSSPTGNLIHFQSADGSSDLWTVDVSGTLQAGSVPSTRITGNITANSAPWSGVTGTPTTLAGYGITNGVSAIGSYADPSWITSLAGSKISGNISGNAASITGSITESQVTGLSIDLAGKANDSAVVHLTGTETITGSKTFSSTILGNISGNAATATTAASATTAGSATNFTGALAGDVTGTQGVTVVSSIGGVARSNFARTDQANTFTGANIMGNTGAASGGLILPASTSGANKNSFALDMEPTINAGTTDIFRILALGDGSEKWDFQFCSPEPCTPATTGLQIAKTGIVTFASGQTFPGAGTGTVTSFSSGNLAPLFTTSVATATTTPALSFSLSSQAANSVLAGPNGAAGAPTFRSIVAADLPATISSNTTGTAANVTGTVAVGNGGTGATTAATARTTLGAAASGANGDITSLTALTSVTSAVTMNNASNSFTGTHSGNGAGLTNLTAANISAGTAGISITGNAATATSATTATTATTAATATNVAFSGITGATNTTAALVVGAGASLAFTGTSTLDMSANTSANAFKVPVIANAAPTISGTIAYDSTNNVVKVGVNGATQSLNNTRSICYVAGADNNTSALDTTYTQKSFFNNLVGNMTVTAAKCQVDAGSVTMNVQKNNLASAITSSVACTTTPGTWQNLTLSGTTLALGDSLDLSITAASTAKRLTVCVAGAVN